MCTSINAVCCIKREVGVWHAAKIYFYYTLKSITAVVSFMRWGFWVSTRLFMACFQRNLTGQQTLRLDTFHCHLRNRDLHTDCWTSAENRGPSVDLLESWASLVLCKRKEEKRKISKTVFEMVITIREFDSRNLTRNIYATRGCRLVKTKRASCESTVSRSTFDLGIGIDLRGLCFVFHVRQMFWKICGN